MQNFISLFPTEMQTVHRLDIWRLHINGEARNIYCLLWDLNQFPPHGMGWLFRLHPSSRRSPSERRERIGDRQVALFRTTSQKLLIPLLLLSETARIQSHNHQTQLVWEAGHFLALKSCGRLFLLQKRRMDVGLNNLHSALITFSVWGSTI